MNYRRLYQIILSCALLCTISVTAQIASTETDSKDDSLNKENLIHFGDLIDVDVLGSFEYDWRGRLTPEGFLSELEFVENPVYALCRSEADVARDIAKGYEKLLREPKVVVRVIDRSNRANSILEGAVKKPQRFQIKRPIFLNELLIIAGGLSERASGDIRIFRPQNLSCAAYLSENAATSVDVRERFVKTSQGVESQMLNVKIAELINGNKDANPQILSGDIVTVLEAEPIYIIGGVNSPKQIASRAQITLSRAVDSAGGLTKNSQENSITIFRRTGRETKIIEADLAKIKAKQAEDIVLQAYDIVDVGEKGRERKKFPPIIQLNENGEAKPSNLPLRIID